MPAEPVPCDNCGKDIPESALADGTAGALRGATLCPTCLPQARTARRNRTLAIGGIILALAGIILRLTREGGPAPDDAGPPADPRPAGDVPEGPEMADGIAALRKEMSERLAALERPDGTGTGDLAVLADAVDAIRMKLADFETRLARIEASGPAADPSGAIPPASAGTPLPDPLLDGIRAGLSDRDPRKRLAALERLAELAPDRAASLSPRIAPLLADEYGYVRREAARQAGTLALADLAGTLVSRLAAEDDLLARDQVCRALAAITGIPYDPAAHTGEMLARQIERWKTWTESR